MFSVITNIYNKKTKGPTLMELFTATGKLEKIFLKTRAVRCVHYGWHVTHRYDIQVVATYASASVLYILIMHGQSNINFVTVTHKRGILINKCRDTSSQMATIHAS
jgi:uncharacterized Fe-S radical SAM superfamily protein PflX